jgi:hypothetical protein
MIDRHLPEPICSLGKALSDPPMQILITLRMRLPVAPFQSPFRTRSEKSAILSSTAWTLQDHSGCIARARFKIGMMNLGYNILRLVQLEHGWDAMVVAGRQPLSGSDVSPSSITGTIC